MSVGVRHTQEWEHLVNEGDERDSRLDGLRESFPQTVEVLSVEWQRLVSFDRHRSFLGALPRNFPPGVQCRGGRDAHGTGRDARGGTALDLDLIVLK